MADDDATDELAEVEETVVAAVAVERNDADEVRRKMRQACARRLTAMRGAEDVSSSGSGSGLTVDLKRILAPARHPLLARAVHALVVVVLYRAVTSKRARSSARAKRKVAR